MLFDIVLSVALNAQSLVVSVGEEPVASDGIVVGIFDLVFNNLKKRAVDGSSHGATSGDTFSGVEGSHAFESENVTNDLLDHGNSATTTDDFKTVDIALNLGFKVLHDNSESFPDLSIKVFKFFSGQVLVEIKVFEQEFEVDTSFLVGTQDLSLLFDGFQESQSGLGTADNVLTRLFLKDLAIVFKNVPIEVTGTKISLVDLIKHSKLFTGE